MVLLYFRPERRYGTKRLWGGALFHKCCPRKQSRHICRRQEKLFDSTTAKANSQNLVTMWTLLQNFEPSARYRSSITANTILYKSTPMFDMDRLSARRPLTVASNNPIDYFVH
ncbi:uncharacterized protein ARMOST_02153 [Armillaria ostoyae]|uniref:Uncharacterized protein n=1 Tax=Armillaria ostoyae TaxID=47428 RepID=A0A284QQX1_ARMOS|nr:uncharacterized protein ARMOST_02153 [Armillaria ostoyae]